jgi:hypothetical protein
VAAVTSRAFYRRWIGQAFARASDAANTVSLIGGIVGALLVWKLPQFERLGAHLTWLLPLVAAGPVFLYRVLRAPLDIFRELDERRQTAEDRLREKRDSQAIADFLTEQHDYGVHQLLHQPPGNEAELETWQQRMGNWNKGIFLRRREYGCTPQDLSHVMTIAVNDLPLVTGAPIEVALKMHKVRLDRISAISAKYAGLSAEAILHIPTSRANQQPPVSPNRE